MQEERNDLLTLPLNTWNCTGQFRVIAGYVNIYITLRRNGVTEGELFFCQRKAGDRIPSCSYQDKSYRRWSFVLRAASEDAALCRTEEQAEGRTQLEFLMDTPAAEYLESGLVNPENAFSQSLAEWYQEKIAFGEHPEPPAVPVRKQKKNPPEQITKDTPWAQSPGKQQAETVSLSGNTVFCTDQRQNTSFRIRKGSVQVYLVSRYGQDQSRAIALGTLGPQCRIPSFYYLDRSHTVWFLQMIAGDRSAELVREAEAGDPAAFLESCGQKSLAGKLEAGENFASVLLDWYSAESLKALPSDIDPEEKKTGSSGSDYEQSCSRIYRVVARACELGKIACLTEDELKIACPDRELTVERIAEASHFICRQVVLEENWWQDDCGILIGEIDKIPVACIPGTAGRYRIFYGDTGRTEKLTAAVAKTIYPSAWSIARTLPGRKCSKRDIREFCLREIRGGYLAAAGILALTGTLIGILIPTLNQKIYDDYIPLGNYSQLIQICMVIASFMIGNMFMEMVKNLMEYRIGSRMTYSLQNAAIYRSFRLPEKFFRNYDSADLTGRILQLDEIAAAYTDTLVSGGFTALFSLGYLYKLFHYSAKLAWIALAALATVAVLFFVLSIQSARYEKVILKKKGEADSRLFQYLNAIDKIRLAGAEKKATIRYLQPMREREKALIRKNHFSAFSGSLRGVAVTVITMLFYYVIIKKEQTISMGNFTAFQSAFGAMAGAAMGFVDGLVKIYLTRPNLRRVMPLFECSTEYAEKGSGAQYVTDHLNGKIELRDVSFRYGENLPLVLKNLNMTFHPGEYIGIVGKSGCGKSTLFKLLLGFESPGSGMVLYDGNNLRDLEKKSFRKNLGVVLQNGKLINGSIAENITVTRPRSTMKEVRQVIKAVGLEEDIRQMPMGLQTMLNENCSTISGGQQQRILIARAIIGSPSILLLDEATSALDNITQKTVCDSLDHLNATRVVIAHRLSTIKNCDRIYVLDQGRVIEEGNYQQLMENHGLFYEMAQRQLVESGEDREH